MNEPAPHPISLPPVSIVGIGQHRPVGSTAPEGDRQHAASIDGGNTGDTPPHRGRAGSTPVERDQSVAAVGNSGGRSSATPIDGGPLNAMPGDDSGSDARAIGGNRSGSRASAFDGEWFGMTDPEAAELDSWERVSLEVAVEALDDAGVGYSARGSNAAVVFGACGCGAVTPCRDGACGGDGTGDPGSRASGEGAQRTGVNVAHRLSRVLELRGPSLVLDSGGSSSVVAVDMAVRLLADPTVPFVIAGGVDLTLLSGISDSELAVDPAAPGTCTVVVLQRTADARRAGTRIYAGVGGTMGFHGTESHIPLSTDRAAAHNDEVARSNRGDEPPVLIPISGRDVGELHDSALHLAARISTERSLREFAAATARLLPGDVRAAVLARDLDDAAIQLRALARRIDSTNLPVSAADRRRSAPTVAVPGRPLATEVFGPARVPHRRGPGGPSAGVPNRLDVSGARGSATSEGATTDPSHEAEFPRRGGGLLLLFSGESAPYPGMGRSLAARYPVFARGLMDATDAIVAAGGPRVWTPRYGFGNGAGFEHGGDAGHHGADEEGRAAGSGGPVRCGGAAGNERVVGHGGSVGTSCSRAEFAQAATFAYQVGMAELLAWWGVRPDAVAGYGSGEIAAAAVSGALSLADSARVMVLRGRILARLGDIDAMAVLEATETEALRLVEPMRTAVAVAAIDGPRSVTVSGEPRYIDALVRRAHRRTIFAQRIAATNGSWHPTIPGPRARDLAPELVEQLHGIAPKTPAIDIYSTTRARELIAHTDMGAEYWGENASGPVDLAAALERAATEGISTILEVAPHPSLNTTVREHTFFRDSVHPVAARGDEAATLLRALAHLHLEGRSLDWTALGPFSAPPPRRRWRRGTDAPVVRPEEITSSPTGSPAAGSPQPVSHVGSEPRSPDDFAVDGRLPEDTLLSDAGPSPTTDMPSARAYLPEISATPSIRAERSAAERGESTASISPSISPPIPVRELFPAVEVDSESTYVVTGGLSAPGVAAVCWLLEAGAHDVVLLTPSPRALPVPLDGMEDRIVLVRCDIADREDLAHVLHDLRECGPPIRGVVHAESAGDAAANGSAGSHSGRAVELTANVLELTAADTPDFTVLMAAPGTAAVLDELAGAHGYRRMVRVDWDGEVRVSGDDAPGARE